MRSAAGQIAAHLKQARIVRKRCAERRTAGPAEFDLQQIATDQYMVLFGEPPDPVAYRLPAACQLEELNNEDFLRLCHSEHVPKLVQSCNPGPSARIRDLRAGRLERFTLGCSQAVPLSSCRT